MDSLSCRTEIVTLPRLMSLGGLDSKSRNLRFWLAVTLLFEKAGLGTRLTGLAARISSGSSSGRGPFPEYFNLDFAGHLGPSPFMIFGDSSMNSGPSTGFLLSASLVSAKGPFVV